MTSVETSSKLLNYAAKSRRKRGFSLMEVMVAAGILAVFVCTSLIAMTQLNRYAAVARLRTLALGFAQQKVDFLMTTPWSVSSTRPASLAVGTTTENNLPLDNDTFNTQAGLSSSFTNLDLQVTATRTTQITDVSTRIFRAAVTVTYVYRGRTYSVSLTSLRATDNI